MPCPHYTFALYEISNIVLTEFEVVTAFFTFVALDDSGKRVKLPRTVAQGPEVHWCNHCG